MNLGGQSFTALPLHRLSQLANYVCGKILKVILSLYMQQTSATKRSRKHCSFRHYSLEKLFITTLGHGHLLIIFLVVHIDTIHISCRC